MGFKNGKEWEMDANSIELTVTDDPGQSFCCFVLVISLLFLLVQYG